MIDLKMQKLQILQDEVVSCFKCELSKTRTNIVFSRGNPNSNIVFVGEAPGKNEDLQGVPFVGKSGKLLDNMIIAMGLKVEDIYICNIVKCRPPENRKPSLEEMEACKSHLSRQLAMVKTKVIVALGATATEGLLGPGVGITKRHGKWGEYNNIPVMPTYHPAALLYNPTLKSDVVEDLKIVMQFLKDKIL